MVTNMRVFRRKKREQERGGREENEMCRNRNDGKKFNVKRLKEGFKPAASFFLPTICANYRGISLLPAADHYERIVRKIEATRQGTTFTLSVRLRTW